MTFAEREFTLGRVLGDGATERAHRDSAARQWAALGRKPKAPEPLPVIPAAVEHLWRYYRKLSLGLAVNGQTPAVVTWESLRAWCVFMDLQLEPWEAEALTLLGRLHAAIQLKKSASNSGN